LLRIARTEILSGDHNVTGFGLLRKILKPFQVIEGVLPHLADCKIFNNYPWSTPIKEYKNFGGIRLGSSALTIYQRPDADFCYWEFTRTEIEYNCKDLKR
jgi:hypothetical protein